jgi:hypothetical protein
MFCGKSLKARIKKPVDFWKYIMTRKLSIVVIMILATAFYQSVFAQSPAPDALKHFAVKGLSFDYPAAIELEDHSTPVGQHFVIQAKGQAQIMIVSRYAQINTAEELAAARHEVVDSFIETMWQQIHEHDPNLSRTPAQIEVAGRQAPGVRLRAVLENQPGNAEIYSLQLGPRLVLLSLIGTDREIAASAPVWLAIRRTLKIEPSAEESSATVHPSTTSRSGRQLYLGRID